MPKIISEFCELVKLCDINRSGPVFSRQCITHLILNCYSPHRFVDLEMVIKLKPQVTLQIQPVRNRIEEMSWILRAISETISQSSAIHFQ